MVRYMNVIFHELARSWGQVRLLFMLSFSALLSLIFLKLLTHCTNRPLSFSVPYAVVYVGGISSLVLI